MTSCSACPPSHLHGARRAFIPVNRRLPLHLRKNVSGVVHLTSGLVVTRLAVFDLWLRINWVVINTEFGVDMQARVSACRSDLVERCVGEHVGGKDCSVLCASNITLYFGLLQAYMYPSMAGVLLPVRVGR